MNRRLFHFCLCLFAFACLGPAAQLVAQNQLLYTIGNSLTQDIETRYLASDGSVPAASVGFHFRHSVTLPYIRHNPADVTEFSYHGRWDQALPNYAFDIVMMQPYLGSSLADDIAAVVHFVDLQPSTTRFLLHTGWANYQVFPQMYQNHSPNGVMQPVPAYFSDLIAGVLAQRPGVDIASNRASELLYSIHQDIQLGQAPFQQFSDLYRDILHLNDNGKYAMHNLLRAQLGLPFYDPFGLDPNVRGYLDQKIIAMVPEPSSTLLLLGVVMGLSARHRRRRT